MQRIYTIGNVILMVGLGLLLTLGTAVPTWAQTATDVVCTGCVASTDLADLGVSSADLAAGAVTGVKILDLTITAADLATSAVSSVKIADGAIVNADVSTAAAIAGTKVAPNFGSQNVVTTGNAGVGTTTPSSRLDVVGALTVRGMAAPAVAPAGQGRLYYDSTANKFKVSQNGAAYVDLPGGGGISQWTTSGTNLYYNTGNVGIGTTSPSRAKLQIIQNGTGTYGIALQANSGIDPVLEIDPAGSTNQYLLKVYETGGRLGFLDSQGSEKVSFLQNGDVGIGTTSPNRKVTVYSQGVSTGVYQNWKNDDEQILVGVDDDGGIVSTMSDHALVFRAGNAAGGGNVEYMRIARGGNVGIGTTSPGAYKLAVKGKIHAEEVVVDTGWADFVFKKDYKLMPLEKVAKHIEEAGHLPGIPTEKEVQENGISIGQIQSKLLQKIEEMTLYVIELKKENDQLKGRISSLENRSR